MSELTQSLQIAVTRYPGTMAELARRTAIDRSTLYKIINGQRTPRQEQLERLAEALALNDEQKDTLLLQVEELGLGMIRGLLIAFNGRVTAGAGAKPYLSVTLQPDEKPLELLQNILKAMGNILSQK